MNCEIRNRNTGELKVFFKDPKGGIHTEYADAIKGIKDGETITPFVVNTTDTYTATSPEDFRTSGSDFVAYEGEFKVNNPSVVRELGVIPVNTDISTKDGMINSMLADKLLKPTDSKDIFESYGESEGQQAFSTIGVKERLIATVGLSGWTQEGDTFIFDDNFGKEQFGENLHLSESEIQQKLESGDTSGMADPDVFTIRELMLKQAEANEGAQLREIPTTDTNESLVSDLVSFLNSIGVSFETIENYKKKYRIEHGVDPDVKILADFANQVMAFKDGEVSIEDLTEDTVHFIVEGWTDREEIQTVLLNIDQTEEWAEHSHAYREAYRGFYKTEAELEVAVRREVLGKFVTNVIRGGFEESARSETEQNLFQRVLAYLANFFSKINGSRKTLDDFAKRVNILLRNRELQEYVSADEVVKSPLSPMYALSKNSRFYDLHKRTTDVLLKAEAKIDEFQRNATSSLSITQPLDQTKDLLNKLEESENLREELKDAKWTEAETRTKAEALNKKAADKFYALSDPTVDDWNELLESVDSTNLQRAVASITALYGLADTKVRELEIKLESLEEGENLNDTEMSVFRLLDDEIRKALDTIAFSVDKNRKELGEKVYNTLKSEIDRYESRFRAVARDIRTREINGDKLMGEIIDEAFQSNEEGKETAKRLMNQTKKDHQWLYKLFGQLAQSHIPQVAGVGRVLFDMTAKAETFAKDRLYKVLRNLEKHKDGLNRMHNGIYFKSHINRKAEDEARARIRAEVLKDMLGLTESVEELVKAGTTNSTIEEYLNKSGKKETLYEFMQRYKVAVRGRILTEIQGDSLSDQRSRRRYKLYKELGVADATVDFLNKIAADRYDNNKRFQDDKEPDHPVNRAVEKGARKIKADRAKAKSIYAVDGTIRDGLVLHSIQPTDTDFVDLGNGLFLTIEKDATIEAKIAYDIHRVDTYDNSRLEKAKALKEKGEDFSSTGWTYSAGKWTDTDPSFPEGNIDLLREDMVRIDEKLKADGILDPEERSRRLFIYFQRRANITPTDEYFDSLDSRLRILIEESGQEGNPVITDLLDQIQTKRSVISSILRQHRESYDYKEVDATMLDRLDKDTIENRLEEIRDLQKEILQELEDNGADINVEIEMEDLSERKPNLSFYAMFKDEYGKDFKDATFEEREKFILANLPHYGVRSYNYFTKKLESGKMNDKMKAIIEKLGLKEDTPEEELKIAFLLSKLPVYLQRLTVEGYDETINNMQKDFFRVFDDIANDKIKYMKLQADLSYQEDTSTVYRQGVQAYKEAMTKLEADKSSLSESEYLRRWYEALLSLDGRDITSYKEEYHDKEFLTHFGMTITPGGRISAPTQNLDLFEAYLQTLQLRAGSLQAMRDLGKKSVFTRYMGRKTNLERVMMGDTTGVQALFNSFKDGFVYREEEEEKFMNGQIRNIPKLGTLMIPESDLSNDIFKTTILDVMASETYRARVEALEKVNALQENLKTVKLSTKKAVEDTNAWQMIENAKDAQIFGRKVVYNSSFTIPGTSLRIDVSKFLESFRRFVMTHGMGFSGIVALTSLGQSSFQYFVQARGNYNVYRRAMRKANTEFMKLANGSVSDIGKLTSFNKLDLIMQYFGNYELTDRITNSMFGYASRNVTNPSKLFFGVHRMAEFPIIPQVALEKLFEYRFIDGKITSWANFLDRAKAIDPARAEEDISKEFDTHEAQAVYNYLDLGEGHIWDMEKIKAEFPDVDEKYMEEQHLRIYRDITHNISKVNGMIHHSQRSEIQRHPLLSFLMMYKQWLVVASSTVFGPKRVNFLTGNVEVGYVSSAWDILNNSIKDGKTEGFFKAFRRIANELTPTERAAFQNGTTSFAGVTLMIAMLAAGLKFMDDDDDNKDNFAYQTLAYLATRVLNESASSGTVFLGNDYYQFIDSPVASLSTIRGITRLFYFNDLTKEVERGSMKGQNKYWNNVYKMSFLRNLHVWSTAEAMREKRQGYIFFNKQQNIVSPFAISDFIGDQIEVED